MRERERVNSNERYQDKRPDFRTSFRTKCGGRMERMEALITEVNESERRG